MRVSKTAFLIAEGVRGLVRHRNLTVAALFSSLASYSILATFMVVGANLQRAVGEVTSRKEIVAFFRETMPQDSVAVLAMAVQRMPGVAGVRYVSKERALAELKGDLGEAEDLVEAIGTNPLPRSLRITLTHAAQLSQGIATLADSIGTLPGVEDVRYGEEWVERLDMILGRARSIALLVGGLVALSALLVVFTTIRLAVVARRDLVEVLRMVGASGSFVRGPFLIEGVISSLLAMGLALGAAYGLTMAATRWLPTLLFLDSRWIGAALLFAILIGFIGSLFALADVVRRTAPSR